MEDAPRSPTSAQHPPSPHAPFSFLFHVSASPSLSPSCPTTRTSRIPVEAWVPTKHSAIPCRKGHPVVDPRVDAGLGTTDGDSTIARPRCRHRDVSGSMMCPRHDSALGVQGVVNSARRCRLPWISSVRIFTEVLRSHSHSPPPARRGSTTPTPLWPAPKARPPLASSSASASLICLRPSPAAKQPPTYSAYCRLQIYVQ